MKTSKKHINKYLPESASDKAYFIFEKKLKDLFTILLGGTPPLDLIHDKEKAMMFGILYHVKAPRRAENNMITTKELRYINKIYQQMLRKEELDFEELYLSVIEYNIFAVFYFVIEKIIEDKERQAMLKKAFVMHEEMDVDECISYARMYYFSSFYKIMTRVSNVRKKFYFFEMTACENEEISKATHLEPVVSACCPIQKKLRINNNLRPVFKLGVPIALGGFQWVKIPKTLLGDYYEGDEGCLDMYVQSHALNRLKERLDVFDEMTLNHILCLNVAHIESFEHYRGYLLLPVMVYDVKIGYLVCNVVDEHLVVRSFLFITHSCTPEGDKLKEITGLTRSDISYWKIDRLSTLVQVDEAHQPQLLQLFEEAGIQDIMKLKDYPLDIDAIQTANMDGFLDYLRQSEVDLPEIIEEETEKEKTRFVTLKDYWQKNKFVFVVGVLIALFVIPAQYFIRFIKGIPAKLSKVKV